MTNNIFTFGAFLDYLVKGIIALVLTIAGIVFSGMNQDIKEVKVKMEDKEIRLNLIENNYLHLNRQLDKIDSKIDIVIRDAKK